MKPRLDTAPFTREDAEIWSGWIYNHDEPICWRMVEIARKADRRDADLMWALRRWGFIRRTVGGTVFDLDPPRYL